MMQQVPKHPDTAAGPALRARAGAGLGGAAGAVSWCRGSASRTRAVLEAKRWQGGIAVTEGHLSLAPHNTNPILLEWLTGVHHARTLNIYQRHGAREDRDGGRFQRHALDRRRGQTPGAPGASYLTPAGAVMRLFGRHKGREAVAVRAAPADLDIAASRTGERIFLHVANLQLPPVRRGSVRGRRADDHRRARARDRATRPAADRQPGRPRLRSDRAAARPPRAGGFTRARSAWSSWNWPGRGAHSDARS